MRSKSAGEAGLAKCRTASTGPGTWRKLLTSECTNVNCGCPERPARLSRLPVTRLSTATTVSPRSSSFRHRCEPRKPAPPVRTTRLIDRPPGRLMTSWTGLPGRSSTYAYVGEAPPAQGGGVEEVAGVDHAGLFHGGGDLGEVQPAELVPLGQHDQHCRSLADAVRVAGHLDAVQPGVRRPRGDRHRRVVGPDLGAQRPQAVQHL